MDGEGRTNAATAATGKNPVTSTTYNTFGLPTQVNLGSSDSDAFTYDANTGRMSQYKFNINAQSYTGGLTWNSNGTLKQLVISDPFNASDTQSCNYAYDDETRLTSANCGAVQAQTFGYDPFGNITKTGNPGMSFQPTYNAASNRFSTIPGFTPAYDNNGNVTGDGSHAYAWDAEGRPVTLDGVGLTYDALLRMVEQNRSGAYTQIVYAPTGEKLALMNGQTLQKAFVPLPGNATAVYTSSGLSYYRHPDWLGSNRLNSSPSRTYLASVAYAPFGETYSQSGTADPSFTSQNLDTSSGDYDFLFREYSTQGRWPSPDPLGLGAVDLSDPRSWNRYAYVLNDSLDFTDPLGLFTNNQPSDPEHPLDLGRFFKFDGGGTYRTPCTGFFSLQAGWCPPATPPPKSKTGFLARFKKAIAKACSVVPDAVTLSGGFDVGTGVGVGVGEQAGIVGNGSTGELSLFRTENYSAGIIAPDAYVSGGVVFNAPTNSSLNTPPNTLESSVAGGGERMGLSGNLNSVQVTAGPSLSQITAAFVKSRTEVRGSVPYAGYLLNPTRAVCKALTGH